MLFDQVYGFLRARKPPERDRLLPPERNWPKTLPAAVKDTALRIPEGLSSFWEAKKPIVRRMILKRSARSSPWDTAPEPLPLPSARPAQTADRKLTAELTYPRTSDPAWLLDRLRLETVKRTSADASHTSSARSSRCRSGSCFV